jgi:hypothetical protein
MTGLAASYSVTTGTGAVISIIVLGALAILWLVSLFLLVTDSISPLMKIVWFLALTLVAPIGIPLYLILRHYRRRDQPAYQ